MRKWKPFIKYLKRYRSLVLNISLTSFLLSLLYLLYPWYFQLMIDSLLNKNFSLARIVIAISLVTALFSIILSLINNYLKGWLHNRLLLDFRKDYYYHILRLPLKFFHNYQTGKIAQRFFDDVDIVIGTLLGVALTGIIELIKFIIIISVVSLFGIKFFLLSVAVVFLFVLNFNIFKASIEDTSRKIGEKIGQLYSKFYDVIPGVREVKIFTKEKMEERVCVHELCNLYRIKMENFMLFNTMNVISSIISSIIIFVTSYICITEVIMGRMSIGMVLLVTSYLQMLRGPIESISGIFTSLKQVSPAIDRINEISNEVTEKAVNKYVSLKGDNLGIKFSNINFSYDNNRMVLKDINLTIVAGKAYALVGPTGAGKTTLTNLILKHYIPTAGEITIGGISINDIDFQLLREHIGIVPQDPHIFFATIKNNIAYGKKGASDEEIIEAAKAANLYDFIMDLPQKFESMVGERGVKLSGGEKQRIAIARAMLKNPPILILDEATSSLDSKTESLIQEAIQRLIKNRTTIAIAHRLSTIINSDMIVVLKDGQIVEMGNYEELLISDNLFASLYRQQFSKGKVGADVKKLGY